MLSITRQGVITSFHIGLDMIRDAMRSHTRRLKSPFRRNRR